MQEKLDGLQVEKAVGKVMYDNTKNNTSRKFGNADFFFWVTSFTLYFNHMQKSACFLHMLLLVRLLLWLLEYLHLAE